MARPVENLDELLEILMPWAGEFAIMLRAFFDASTHGNDTFCVAGLAYGAERAKKAERAWRALMGDRIGHLTDMHARKGDFADFTDEDADRTMRGQIGVINRFASFGVAFSCSLSEINKLLPTNCPDGREPLLDGFQNAYPALCHLAMHTMGLRSQFDGKDKGIAYIFETGDQDQRQSRRFIDHASQNGSPLRDVYQFRSLGYLDKEDARLLESADVLAWEWAKHIERLRKGQPMRRSLAALINEQDKRGDARIGYKNESFFCLHNTGFELERFCQKVTALIAATTKEEVQAIADSCYSAAQAAVPTDPASSSKKLSGKSS